MIPVGSARALVPARPGSSRRARGVVAAISALAMGLAVAACNPGSASPAPSAVSGAAPSAPIVPAASVGAASPRASACATPAPLAPIGMCTAPSASPGATGSPGVTGSPAAGASTSPGGAAGSPGPGPSASPAPTAGAAPRPAPTSAVGFRVRKTVVPMGFPLPRTATIRYGDGWGAPRVGVARPYEQIRGVAPDGTYLRAHDGIDILVKLGTPVQAPFSGAVIDPARRWKPWDPSRYGRVVAIESDEATSPGYVVILAHLSTRAVKVGDHVVRGEVVGKTGNTGNAAGMAAHLHLELRAPFLIRYGYAKVIRYLDVFDAEPSVRAADPRLR